MADFAIEDGLGFSRIAGVDEAGRGPLAGPVVAAAVILPRPLPVELLGITDSKKLSTPRRAQFNAAIQAQAEYAIGIADIAEIASLNILGATMLAMRRAVDGLSPPPDFVLVDGNRLPAWEYAAKAVVKGDNLSLSIAAASIIAKQARDQMMQDLAKLYPHYGFDRHAGYGTAAHIAAIRQYGASPVHRFGFLRGILDLDVARDTPPNS